MVARERTWRWRAEREDIIIGDPAHNDEQSHIMACRQRSAGRLRGKAASEPGRGNKYNHARANENARFLPHARQKKKKNRQALQNARQSAGVHGEQTQNTICP